MSAWAYRKCEKCGSTVHINHTCKQWNSKECDGDPWNETVKRKNEIKKLKDRKEKLASDIAQIDNMLERLGNSL